MSRPLSVIGHGMVTAVGNSAPSTCAAIWGRIRTVSADNLYDVTTGEQLAVARPTLHQWWEGRDMLAELAAPAVEECMKIASAQLGVGANEVPILQIVAPSHRPWRWPDLERLAMTDLARRLDMPLHESSRLAFGGRTGLHEALAWAVRLLDRREAPCCIVVGVESFLRQLLINSYVRAGRVLGKENSNGFSPGEAAAAVLIAPTGASHGQELVIHGIGFANDPSGAGGDINHPVTGNGLTAAIRQALELTGAQFHDLDLRCSDANGEHFKFREASIAEIRLSRPRPPGMPRRRFPYFDHWHPIEYVGEIGAAIGPMMLGYMFDAGSNGYFPGSTALLHASEDNGDRLALVVKFRGARGRDPQ